MEVGEIPDAAMALMRLGRICQATGGPTQLRQLQERLLTMLAAGDGSDASCEFFPSRAIRWAQALGIPVAHSGELVERSRQPGNAGKKLSEPGGGSHDHPDR